MNPKFTGKCFYHCLTYKCNWNCSYCDFPNKEKLDTIKENLLFYIDLIKKYKNYLKDIEFEIEGGEIGLISEEILDIWFNSNIKESYQISTNGKFIQKYYNKYKDKIHYIVYHCIKDFKSIENIKFKIYDIPNIDYIIVITKKNYKEFPKLLKKYPNINWIPEFLHQRHIKIKDFLNYKDFEWLYKNINYFDNIPKYIKENLKLLQNENFFINDLKKFQKICALIYNAPLIDLVKMRIYRCSGSISGNYVNLTEENFKKLIKNDMSLFLKYEKMCNYCYNNKLLYIFKNKKNLKNYFK